MESSEKTPGTQVRDLIQDSTQAALGTIMRPGENGQPDGHPYTSLVLTACGPDGAPLLLLSDLADHAKNIAADDRVSLLFDGTAGLEDPLTGARASVLGRATRNGDADLKARYLDRQPSAQQYVDFSDFAIYRIEIARAHLVAGFGFIHWLTAQDVLG